MCLHTHTHTQPDTYTHARALIYLYIYIYIYPHSQRKLTVIIVTKDNKMYSVYMIKFKLNFEYIVIS